LQELRLWLQQKQGIPRESKIKSQDIDFFQQKNWFLHEKNAKKKKNTHNNNKKTIRKNDNSDKTVIYKKNQNICN
jgi:hypothetical protein